MTEGRVALGISRMEASHLSDLVTQFRELLSDSSPAADPAVARLVPDAYADDAAAAQDFRELTQADLLTRRREDATLVLTMLAEHAAPVDELDHDDPALRESVVILLETEDADAWMRLLAALRLVLAERLGIHDEDDHDDEDPRFGIYDWVGYRLDGLVSAADGADGVWPRR